MTTIEIIVAPTGESRIETKGFVGGRCREASLALEQALGHIREEKLTSEFYLSVESSQAVRQQS